MRLEASRRAVGKPPDRLLLVDRGLGLGSREQLPRTSEKSAKNVGPAHLGSLMPPGPLSTRLHADDGSENLEKHRNTIYISEKRRIRRIIIMSLEASVGQIPEPPVSERRSPVYPALLGCLTRGRAPSQGDVEAVAARMWIELGHERRQPWERLDPDDGRRRQVLAGARAALSGGEAGTSGLAMRFVLRGH